MTPVGKTLASAAITCRVNDARCVLLSADLIDRLIVQEDIELPCGEFLGMLLFSG